MFDISDDDWSALERHVGGKLSESKKQFFSKEMDVYKNGKQLPFEGKLGRARKTLKDRLELKKSTIKDLSLEFHLGKKFSSEIRSGEQFSGSYPQKETYDDENLIRGIFFEIQDSLPDSDHYDKQKYVDRLESGADFLRITPQERNRIPVLSAIRLIDTAIKIRYEVSGILPTFDSGSISNSF
jgi:hypothetical protein